MNQIRFLILPTMVQSSMTGPSKPMRLSKKRFFESSSCPGTRVSRRTGILPRQWSVERPESVDLADIVNQGEPRTRPFCTSALRLERRVKRCMRLWTQELPDCECHLGRWERWWKSLPPTFSRWSFRITKSVPLQNWRVRSTFGLALRTLNGIIPRMQTTLKTTAAAQAAAAACGTCEPVTA